MISPRLLFQGDPTECIRWVGLAKKLARRTYDAGVISKVWKVAEGVTFRVENNLSAKICKVWIEAGALVTGFQFYLKNPESVKGFSYPDFFNQAFAYGYDLASTDDFYMYRLVPADVETYRLFLDRSQKKRTSQSVPVNQRNRIAINFAGPLSGLPLYYIYQKKLSPPALNFRYYETIYVLDVYANSSPYKPGGFIFLGHSSYELDHTEIPLAYQKNTTNLNYMNSISVDHNSSSEDIDSIALGGFRGSYVVGTNENDEEIKRKLNVFVIPVSDEDDGYYITYYIKVYSGRVKKKVLVAECSLFRYECFGLFSWDFSSDGSQVTGLVSSSSPYPSRIHEIVATISIQLTDGVYSITAEIIKNEEHTFQIDTSVETTEYAYDDEEGTHYYTDKDSTSEKNYTIPICSFYNKSDLQKLVTITYTESSETHESIDNDVNKSSLRTGTTIVTSQLNFPSGTIVNLANYTIEVDWYKEFDYEELYYPPDPPGGSPYGIAHFTGHNIISGSGYIGQPLVMNPKEEHLIYAKRQFSFTKTLGLSEGIDLDYNGMVYLYNGSNMLLEKDISFSLFSEISNDVTGPFPPFPLFPEQISSATDYELLLLMVSNIYTDANVLSASIGYSYLYVKNKINPTEEDYVYAFNLHGHIAPPLEVLDYSETGYPVLDIINAYADATNGFDNLSIIDSTYGDFYTELKELNGEILIDATLYPIALRTDT